MIAVEATVCHDDMVHEEDAHDVACLGYLLRELVICLAWLWAVRWVVVRHCQDGGVVEHGFFHDEPHVHGCLSDASLAEVDALDEPKVLVHQYDVKPLSI